MTVGIIAFAMVGMLGLLPIALSASRSCVDETRAAQLARMVFSTVQSEPFTAARCFGKDTDAPVDFSTLDRDSPLLLLYGSYRIAPLAERLAVETSTTSAVPWIVRTDAPPADAEYRIELRFQPVTTTTAATPPPGAPTPAPRGSAMHLTIRMGRPDGAVVFEGVQFLHRLRRHAPPL